MDVLVGMGGKSEGFLFLSRSLSLSLSHETWGARGMTPGQKKKKILPRCGTTFIVITVYECCSLLHISYH